MVFVLIIRSLGKTTLLAFQINCLKVFKIFIGQAMSLIEKSCTVSIMQYFSHILIIALKYVEILIKVISTQYLFYRKVMQTFCHAKSFGHAFQMFHWLDIFRIYD